MRSASLCSPSEFVEMAGSAFSDGGLHLSPTLRTPWSAFSVTLAKDFVRYREHLS